jgi:hypothetical protein
VELSLGDVAAFRNKQKKVSEIPFNSTNKYQVRKALAFELTQMNLFTF